MIYLVVTFVIFTFLVLATGVFAMARGGNISKKYSNKLMILRVLLQGIAVCLLGVLFLFYDKQ